MKKLIYALLLIVLVSILVFSQSGTIHNGARIVIERTGDVTLTPKTGKKVSVTGQFAPYSTKAALTPGATVTVDPTLGDFFTLTPAQDEAINATVVGVQGQMLFIKVLTSGVTSYTLTFGTNFKSTGTLATGTTTAKIFLIHFLSDGTNWIEVGRTAAQ
jgi:hypothetical protein